MKDVLISVKTVQTDQNGEETMELTTEGSFGFKGSGFLIKYDDKMLEEGKSVETTVKSGPLGSVIISRSGEYASRISVKENERCDCLYSTPFGAISMGFYGEKVENNLTENGGTLMLQYSVDFNKSEMSKNKVYITVKEVN